MVLSWCLCVADQLMTVIKSIASEVDQCIATGQVGRYSLCQALDQLVRQHLSE